jgi:hypothetical protein
MLHVCNGRIARCFLKATFKGSLGQARPPLFFLKKRAPTRSEIGLYSMLNIRKLTEYLP